MWAHFHAVATSAAKMTRLGFAPWALIDSAMLPMTSGNCRLRRAGVIKTRSDRMWLRRGSVIALLLAAAAAQGKRLVHQQQDAPLMTEATTRSLLYNLREADRAATGLQTLSVTLTLPPASVQANRGQTHPWPLIVLYNGFKVPLSLEPSRGRLNKC